MQQQSETISIITSRGRMAEGTSAAVLANIMAIYDSSSSEATGYAMSFTLWLPPVGGIILAGADITPEMHEKLRLAALVGQPDFN